MPCTTILVGKKASYDGSTMIARNDDSPSGQFTPKKFVVVHPEEQPKKYKSVLSHVEIDLPEDPMRYTAVPNALDGEGIWAAHGVNAAGGRYGKSSRRHLGGGSAPAVKRCQSSSGQSGYVKIHQVQRGLSAADHQL